MKVRAYLSLRAKLVVLVIAAVLSAQSFIAGVLLWQEAARYTDAKRASMLATAQVLAAGTANAVRTGNRNEIRSVLRAIGRLPGIDYAGVTDARGVHLADLGATEQLDSDIKFGVDSAPVSLLRLLRSRTAEMLAPVISGGQTVGHLRIVSGTGDLPAHLRNALGQTFAGALAALALALLVALALQRSITRPLTDLTRAMASVSERHDYDIALTRESRDEIGVLVRGFNTMIGEIRERDGKLKRHRESLEREVAERTQDFREAKESAEAANRAKSDFLASMSHEIRTPMNGILVMADLLAAGNLPPRSRRYAEVIARSGQSLVAIINDILDFSKIEAGKLEVEILAVDIAECVDNVIDLFAERAQGKGLDLAAVIETATPRYVAADPVRLNQVLGNLVNNALKFTESGSVTVRVRGNGGRIEFAVVDTGIGIGADKVGAIFGAFAQADQSTTRKFGGTGLGLSISQRLVAAMGGKLSVASKPGEGSTFQFALEPAGEAACVEWPVVPGAPEAVLSMAGGATRAAIAHYLAAAGYSIVREPDLSGGGDAPALVVADGRQLALQDKRSWPAQTMVIALSRFGETGLANVRLKDLADVSIELPLSRDAFRRLLVRLRDGAPLQEDKTQQARPASGTAFSGARVLVVDDGAVNRVVVQEALGNFGILPQMVCDGREAVEACARERFDLVLMDGSMPGMDGFEASRRIRAHEAETGAPRQTIVALTAHVVGRVADAWRDADMDGVLHKPFTLAGLGECLDAWIGGDARKPSANAQPQDGAADVDAAALDGALVAQLRDMAAMGRGDFVSRVTGLYREHAPTALADFERASQSGDVEGAARAAHALKSMSLNAGAQRVARLAGGLEKNAREGRASADAHALQALKVAIGEACAALQSVVEAA